MTYQEMKNDFNSMKIRNTKEVDLYNRKLIKLKADVSDLEAYLSSDYSVFRTYFQISLAYLDTNVEQITFIEKYHYLYNDWWQIDVLLQFIKKPVNFDYAFNKAKIYIESKETFMRRFGYVIFLLGLQKDERNCQLITSLIKDDDEYYVQMAEAWLIADMGVYQFEVVYNYLKDSKVKYNILGKAIQKMCDSFRISDIDKERVKALRSKLKEN